MKNCNPFCLKSKLNNDVQFQQYDLDQEKLKLEEEICKRLYCEEVTKDLQNVIIKLEQLLAAASHSSLEKDKAIEKLSQEWEKVQILWEEMKNKHDYLVQDIQTEQEISRMRELEIMKKVEQWNLELTNALELAAGYKELNNNLNAERQTWKTEMHKQMIGLEKQLLLIDTQKNVHKVQNQKLEEQLNESKYNIAEVSLIQDLERCTTTYSFVGERLRQKTQAEILKAQELIAEHEAQIADLKEQNKALVREIEKEKSVVDCLQQKKYEIMNELLEAEKNTAAARDQISFFRHELETSATEIRDFYNSQLPIILDSMEKEFKQRSENIQLMYRAEDAIREKEIQDMADINYQLLDQRYKDDINGLRKLYKNMLSELQHKIRECEEERISIETTLRKETDWKNILSDKLHSTLKTQLKETTNILISETAKNYEYQEPESDRQGGI